MPVEKLFYDDEHKYSIECYATNENKICINLKDHQYLLSIDLDYETSKEFINELIEQLNIINEEGGKNE